MQNKYLTFYYMKLNILILVLIIGILTYFLCKNKENFGASSRQPICQKKYELKMYYTDWCADCRKAKEEYNKLENCIERTGLSKNINIPKKLIICDSTNISDDCEENANKYPKIILINTMTKKEKEYTGNITEQNLRNWMDKMNINF